MRRKFHCSRGGPGTRRGAAPSLSVYANPKYNAGIATFNDYREETTRKIEALTRSTLAGSDYHQEMHAWDFLEPSVGSRLFTYVDQLVTNRGSLPLVYGLNPIVSAARAVPATLSAVAWNHASMTTAFNNTLTDLHNSHMGSMLNTLQIGSEVDDYFVLNPSEIAAYAAFLTTVAAHAHTLWTHAAFTVTCGIGFEAISNGSYASGGSLAAIWNAVDLHSFIYNLPSASSVANDLDQIVAAIPLSATFMLYQLAAPSAAAVGSSQALQSTALLAALSAMNALNASQPFSKVTAATIYQLNDVSTAVMTSSGIPTGFSQDYFGSIGLIDTAYVEKAVWIPLVALLKGDPGITGSPVPGTPVLVTPVNGAVGVAVLPSIEATATGALSYTIKIGLTNPPTGETFLGSVGQYTPPSPLTNSTLYYIQFIAHNTGGDTTSAVWSFTTAAIVSADHPKLMITPAVLAKLAVMKADYELNTTSPPTWGGQWYKAMKIMSADRYPFTAGQVPSDVGFVSGLLYQVTGEQVYADDAWAHAQSFLVNMNVEGIPNSANKIYGNQSREHFASWVACYDWGYQGWTTEQRNQYLTQLNLASSTITGELPESFSDVDQPIGDYFGMACLYEATKSYNPQVVSDFAHIRWGGTFLAEETLYTELDTVRKFIRHYYGEDGRVDPDGDWPEGSEYSDGSSRLGIWGYALLQTTDAAAHFPEILDWMQKRALFLIHEFTPDLKQKPQWGNDENPRAPRPHLGIHSIGPMIISQLADGPVRQKLQRRILDSIAVNGFMTGYTSKMPVGKAMAMVDPYATAAANLDDLPLQAYYSGQGLLYRRTGNSALDAQMFIHAHPEQSALWNHGVSYQGNYQLYRRGEWVWTGPIVYLATGINENSTMAPGSNCTAIEGLTHTILGQNIPRMYNKVHAQVSGTNFEFLASTRGGGRYVEIGLIGTASSTVVPPNYVNEYYRGVLFVTTADKSMDLVIVIERINAVDPESLPRFSFYKTGTNNEQQLIQNNGRWKSHIWDRVAPTQVGLVGTWTTAVSAQLCRDVWLLPSDATVTVQDMSNTTLNPNSYSASERTFRVVYKPATNIQWNKTLYVRSVRNSGVSAPVETALTVSDDAFGCHITCSGNPDIIVVANGIQGPDLPLYAVQADCDAALPGVELRSTGFTFDVTVVGTSADLYFPHLDPTATWRLSINGSVPVAMVPSSQGFYTTNIAGAGAKTIVVSVI